MVRAGSVKTIYITIVVYDRGCESVVAQEWLVGQKATNYLIILATIFNKNAPHVVVIGTYINQGILLPTAYL